jgi:RHS repeat-associated protein
VPIPSVCYSSRTVFVSTPLKKPHDPRCSLNERLSNRSVHGDGLSSTQLVTDDTGAQVGRIVYGAWGETLSSNESVPGVLDVGFVGGLGVRNDSATGLIWMRHRWYDSALGRFISRDPIGLAEEFQFPNGAQKSPDVSLSRAISDSNLYAYAGNNPIDFVDPEGLAALVVSANACPNGFGGWVVFPVAGWATLRYKGMGLDYITNPNLILRVRARNSLGQWETVDTMRWQWKTKQLPGIVRGIGARAVKPFTVTSSKLRGKTKIRFEFHLSGRNQRNELVEDRLHFEHALKVTPSPNTVDSECDNACER